MYPADIKGGEDMVERLFPEILCRAVIIRTLNYALVLIVASIIPAVHAEAATNVYSWSTAMGGSGSDFGRSVAADDDGNIYVTGEFAGAANFDRYGDNDVHTSAGGTDIFLTKINSDGSYGWTKTMGGTEDDYCSSVAVDGDGNIYATGYFRGTVDFDPGAGTDTHVSAGERDIFILKINADGSYGWTQKIGGSSIDGGRAVAVDGNGNIFTTGFFSGSVDFDFSPGTIDVKISAGNTDIFLTKINADGSYGWTQKMGGAAVDNGLSVAVDASGNIYLAGYFQGLYVDFDPGQAETDFHSSAGGRDIFVTRINSDGSYGWTKTMGGTGNDDGRSVAVDRNGHVYVTGSFNDVVDFDPGAGTDSHASTGLTDIFLVRLTADGSYGWTKTMGGTSADDSLSVALHRNGDVYVTGSFIAEPPDVVDFDPGADTDSHSSIGLSDIFLLRMKADGAYGWTQTMGGSSIDSGSSVAVDGIGNIYVTGYFMGTAYLNPGDENDYRVSAGSYDAFLVKFDNITSTPPSVNILLLED